MPKRTRPQGPPRAIAYYRVSTEEQAQSGFGLGAQRRAVRATVEARGWDLVAELEDAGVSGGKHPLRRPGLTAALELLGCGDADVLVVAKGDRLSRRLADVVELLDRAEREGWAVLASDLGVDPSSIHGRLVQHVMAAVSEWERGAIAERTRQALADARAKGTRLGRPRSLPDATVARIVAMRGAGESLAGIARALSADGTPTATGGRWYASTVQRVLDSAARQPAQASP